MPSPAYALLLQSAFPLIDGLLAQAQSHQQAGEHPQTAEGIAIARVLSATLAQIFAPQAAAPAPTPAPQQAP